MINIEKKAENLFDKIRTRFTELSLGDEKAKSTTVPEEARFFNFDYVSRSGKNFGNVHISIVEPTILKVFFSQNITDELSDEEREEWEDFLRGLRKFARRHLMQFDARDIGQSSLKLRDVQQQVKSSGNFDADDDRLSESQVIVESMYGSKLRSYEDRGPVTIRVHHSDYIDPEKRGARARKIESIFLETHEGERFKLDFNNLDYARASARHLAEGGELHDDIGQSITNIISEMQAMKHFVRGAKLREFSDPETTEMVQSALRHYQQQKHLLKRLRKGNDYKDYVESFVPENPIEHDINVEALRERFVKKIYDDRFDEALPYVYRAYQREQAMYETEMANEFESWAESIYENNWDSPDDAAEIAELDKIMSTPLEVGQDGLNSAGALADIIGDDELTHRLYHFYKETQDPEADARPVVIEYLRELHPDLAAKYEANLQPPQPAQAPEQPAVPNQTVAAPTTDAPVVQEDNLVLIKRLAGLVKK